MKQLHAIQNEVKVWSENNFGAQCSKSVQVVWTDAKDVQHHVPMFLGSLAPLLGIQEEVGELLEAVAIKDKFDAIGDIMIYLCDYASREDLSLHGLMMAPVASGTEQDDEVGSSADTMNNIVIQSSKLCHHALKYHQRIREYQHQDTFKKEASTSIVLLMYHLRKLVAQLDQNWSLLMIVNMTWNDVVSKRNWKADPING